MRMEDTDLYKRACLLSDAVYEVVVEWPSLAQRTVGHQLVSSLDSVGANLIEGEGRGIGADAIRFFRIARGSCREMRHWIARAQARNLIDPVQAGMWLTEAMELVMMVQGLIRYREGKQDRVGESTHPYDPFLGENEG